MELASARHRRRSRAIGVVPPRPAVGYVFGSFLQARCAIGCGRRPDRHVYIGFAAAELLGLWRSPWRDPPYAR